ncbi:uroporphyrinogen decarboxylase family protein [Acididesulfobacillus acetoxydans]|nr:uroporphyrinogen decarboxylase family protein [Acididesulfobacillus acetoxydans]
MNALERALTTINLQLPDRVPVDLHSFALAARHSGRPFGEFFHSADLMAEAQIGLWRRFGHDVILLENGTTATAEALGCKVVYPDDAPAKVTEPALNRLSDVGKLRMCNPEKDATLPVLLRTTRLVKNQIGREVFVMGRADQGPFSLAAMLRGINNFLMDLAYGREKENIHQLLDFATEAVIRLALAQLEAGAHATSIGDSLAGPSLISREMYLEYAYPYEKRVVETVKKAGGLIALHICGDTTLIVDKMVETGAQIVEIDERTDLATAKRHAQGRCCLLGQVSPTALSHESAEMITHLAQKTIETAAGGGGLILGPGCAMASDTPDENVHALVQAAKTYGVYHS